MSGDRPRDEFGNLIPTPETPRDWNRAVLLELRAIRMGLQMLLDQGALPSEQDSSLLEMAIEAGEDTEAEAN